MKPGQKEISKACFPEWAITGQNIAPFDSSLFHRYWYYRQQQEYLPAFKGHHRVLLLAKSRCDLRAWLGDNIEAERGTLLTLSTEVVPVAR